MRSYVTGASTICYKVLLARVTVDGNLLHGSGRSRRGTGLVTSSRAETSLQPFQALGYAARSMRGFFALNLPVSAQVRRDFRLDLLGAILFGVFNGSVISYLYVVARTIGVTPFGVSVLVSMPAIGAILALPVSLLVRGKAGRPFMIYSWAFGRALLLLLVFFSGSTPYLLIVSLFLVSSSIAQPFYAAVMQSIYPREFRGRLMSLVRVGSGTATTITSLLAAWLLGSLHVSYTAVFAVGSFLAVSSLAIFVRISPAAPDTRPRQSLRDTFGLLRQNRPFAQYQVWVMLMGFGNIMAATLYPLVIVDKLKAGYGAFGVLAVVSAVGYLASFFVWGRITDRLGPVITMFIIGVGVLVSPAGMLIAPSVFWLAPVALVGGVVLAGFEIGVFAAVIYYAAATPVEVPRYMALHSIFSGVRGLFGPFAATLILFGHHYTISLTAALIISGSGTFMLWQMVRQDERKKQAGANQPASAPPSIKAGSA
jgi:MFS family permease